MAQTFHGIVINITFGDPAPVFGDWGGADITVHATYLTKAELNSKRYIYFNKDRWKSKKASPELLAALRGRSV